MKSVVVSFKERPGAFLTLGLRRLGHIMESEEITGITCGFWMVGGLGLRAKVSGRELKLLHLAPFP